jgi:nicotinamide-nucleotide amidase
MKASIVTIGDEILIGQIVDTNSAWIAQRLDEMGIEILETRSIKDDPGEILGCLEDLMPLVGLIIITGGLGPTNDDLTKDTLAGFFGSEMELDPEVLSDIETLFRQKGRELLDSNRDQALMPVKARTVRNPVGTAPGMWFFERGCHVISLPGVPVEMKRMMEASLIPGLQKELDLPVIVHRTLHVVGLPESLLAERLTEWEAQLPEEIKLAYLPNAAIVRLRLTARGKDKAHLERLQDKEVQKLIPLVGHRILGEGDTSLPKAVGDMMKNSGKTLSIAESCTGGQISADLTKISGSSAYYLGGVVSYSNDSKIRELGIETSAITVYGAVSQQVVEAMCTGVRERYGSDYAVATSGIAGPDGGTENKPVGTVWIAVSGPNGTVSKEYHFGKDRAYNIRLSVNTALYRLWKQLKNDLVD